jgi:two-component system cell cycle response regulator
MYSNDKKKYKISLFGEFTNKSMEDEFLEDSLSGSSKITSYIALVFGFILGLFLVNGYIVYERDLSFFNIILIRLLFISSSITVFLVAKKVKKHGNLIYIITLYQAIMALCYLFTLKQLDSLNYFSVIGLMVIALAIYLLPNKIIFSQIITIAFSILFFIYSCQKIEGLEVQDFYRIIAYQVILLIYCNINYCWTETIKRKKFVANKELLDISSKDPLTGIYNRTKFDDEMDKWISYSERYGNSFSLVLFDIDDFKGINDKYGHLAGDRVVKNIAATINKSIRDTDIFARWGGDEFVLLLPNTDIRHAEEMAERMRVNIYNNVYEPVNNITCSFGVATYEKNDTTQSLLRKADNLLLQAKANGKDRVEVIKNIAGEEYA